MRLIYSFFLFSVAAFLFSACSPKTSEVVATFGDYQIGLDEFKNAYVKSVGSMEEAKDDSLQQLKSYLDLYVNYRMKLRDAEVRGYDSDESIKAELDDYKNQIGKSFIEEKYVVKPGIEQLYEDDKFEYKFKHILVKPDSISMPKARELALELINRIQNGEDFSELAGKYSGDFATKAYGGEIYFIKPGQMPMPNFVDVLLKATPGVVYEKPVLSTAGYHVILVVDKRPVRYKIRVSHIMRDFRDEEGKPDTVNALSTIRDIQKQLSEGVSFDSLAVRYSEDPGSKVRGGDLGFFSRRSMVVEFDSVVFNLKIGEVSDIIKTNFGYHIARCTEEENYPPFEELEPGIRKFFEKNHKSHRFEQFKDKLKDEYGLKLNNEVCKIVQSNNDTLRFADFWDSELRTKIKNQTAYYFMNNEYTVEQLFEKYRNDQHNQKALIDSSFVKRLFMNNADKLVIETKINELASSDPEFIEIMREYKNGVLIFKLQEEEVWSRIELDSAGMYKYYDEHKQNYQWKPRVSYKALISRSDSLIQSVYNAVQSGEEFEKLYEKYSSDKNLGIETKTVESVEFTSDFYSQKAHELKEIGEISKVLKHEKNWFFLMLSDKKSAGQKTFEEAQGEIAGPYQEKLTKAAEAKYVDDLKKTYNPQYNYELLNQIF